MTPRDFLSTIFEPEDTVEVRLARMWKDKQGKKAVHIVRRVFAPASEYESSTCSQLRDIATENRLHVWLGVCPRDGEQTTADTIPLARCLWADLDHATGDQGVALLHKRGLPMPTVLVESGNGCHFYWRLESPVVFGNQEERDDFQGVVKGLALRLGSDPAHNLDRSLRLPGTFNFKVGCGSMCAVSDWHSRPDRRYPLDRFRPLAVPVKSVRAMCAEYTPTSTWATLTERQRESAEEAIERSARAANGQRSETDYGVLCWLAKLGLPEEEVWEKVQGVGKFAESGGEKYFARTWANAAGIVSAENTSTSDMGQRSKLGKDIMNRISKLMTL